MKTNVFLMAIALGAMTLAGCDDDDNIRVDSSIAKAFGSRYPDASRVEWERKAGFFVAEFLLGGIEAEAWYSSDATWHMTETDIRYADLPEAVRKAFETGEYSGWKIEDIDKLERMGLENVYVIEVEQGDTEYDLYYSEDGILVKAGPDDGGYWNYLPSTSHPSSVDEYIDKNHPGARIVEREMDNGVIEMDIVDSGVAKEVHFSLAGEWLSTKTEVRYADVPEAVKQACQGSQYGSWRVDDVDFYETPTGAYYLFELESGDRDVYLKIDTTGNII